MVDLDVLEIGAVVVVVVDNDDDDVVLDVLADERSLGYIFPVRIICLTSFSIF
jgi:hypothetical protein